MGVVEWLTVELELYLLILVDSASECIKELAGGLVSVFVLATNTLIIGALFERLRVPRPISLVLPFVTLSRSLLLYGVIP